MALTWRYITASSSVLLRLFTYVFFRWIPGTPLPPIIFSLAAVYSLGLFRICASTSAYDFVADEINIIKSPVADHDVPQRVREQAHGRRVEELGVQETIFYEKKPPHPFLTILTGLPSPSSVLWTAFTVLVNASLVAMTIDYTYRAALLHPAQDLAFSRLGYVSDSTATILVREPDFGKMPISLSYRRADKSMNNYTNLFDSAWKHGDTVSYVGDDTDFTTTLQVKGLRPDTRYQYVLSNNYSGHFITAPPTGEFSQRQGANGKFTFLHSSCLKRFPYNPFDDVLAIPGLKHLANLLPTLRPHFFLFLGDFIYIDVPRRHGSDVASYRKDYRQVYASPDWPLVSSVDSGKQDDDSDADYSLPWLHVWDDHEVSNDWHENTTGVFPAAFDPYNHYHVAAGPPPYRKQRGMLAPDAAYFAFNQGPASFFLLDTRRFRTRPGRPESSMLGAAQLSDLLAWLATPPPRGIRWKFIISSVPFTRNWRVNALDTWAGYLSERRRILEAIWDINAAGSRHEDGVGVVILSGDRHEHATTAFPPPAGNPRWTPECTAHEFSTSPLSMFYLPFRTYREDTVTGTDASPSDQEHDVCIKYLPDGNSKFGSVQIEQTTGSGQSVLRYTLFVDGEEAFDHLLVAPEGPLKRRERWREGLWT